MSRSIQFLLSLVLLIGICMSCEDRTITRPDFLEPEDNTILLDFTYRTSNNYYGFAKFQMLSNNIIHHDWSFGFLDKEGKLVTSNSSSPGIFFPANGSYEITLKGTGIDDNEIVVTKLITITNFP